MSVKRGVGFYRVCFFKKNGVQGLGLGLRLGWILTLALTPKKKKKIDPDFTDTPYLEILNKKVARKVFISK